MDAPGEKCVKNTSPSRIFDDVGEGFITVCRFRKLLRDIDEGITDEELDGIVAEVKES